jgi:hypothetical protein
MGRKWVHGSSFRGLSLVLDVMRNFRNKLIKFNLHGGTSRPTLAHSPFGFSRPSSRPLSWFLTLLLVSLLSGCSLFSGTTSTSSSSSSTKSCTAVTGDPWSPKINGASASNHDTTTTITRVTLTQTGPITGLGQAAPASQEVSVSIPMTEDLGEYGSLSLQAKVSGFPTDLAGGAFPALVYLSDGTNDLVNMSRAGSGSDCAASGYYTCSGSSCRANSSCSPTWPSSFISRDQWEQHQIPIFGYESVNVFPTCNYTGGSTPPSDESACAFNTTFFPSGSKKLRSGVTYTAKYVLLTSDYAEISGYTATLEVVAIKKKVTRSTIGGAIDVNVFLVGSTNIEASRTAKGQQNLDLLMNIVFEQYAQTNSNIKLGTVNVIEWSCENGGDSYATLSLNDLGALFAKGSAMAPASSSGKSVNLFMVTQITQGGSLTILGLSGGIGGPIDPGLQASGVAFSSFSKLATYNPSCTTSSCPISSQEAAFVDMGATISHEMGHYLGLNHLSEYDGTMHDQLADTPVCKVTQSVSGGSYITHTSCQRDDSSVYGATGKTCNQACPSYSSSAGTFCPDAVECQFNHIMWWTAKKFKEGVGTGDGNVFSPASSGILNYSPFVY